MKRRLSNLSRRRLTTLAATLLLLAVAGGALAYFTSTGTATASASVGTLAAPTGVSAQASGPSVSVAWNQVTAPAGGTLAGYYVQRLNGSTATAACASSPSSLLSGSATSCTDNGDPDGAGVPAGSYTYTVTAVWQSWSSTGSSGSVSVAAPAVSSTSPGSADQGATNDDVTITGSNFVDGATVAFAAAGVTVQQVTYNSQTSLTAEISVSTSAATGPGNVTVTNPDGDQATGTDLFTVNPPPSVGSTSPSAAKQGAYQVNVTITGANLENDASVAFSNPEISVNSVQYVSATQLTANITIARTATTGVGNVTVSNPDGTTATGSGVFTVDPLETVYVANAGSNTVTPIAAATNTTEPNIPVGGFPYGVAVTPNGESVLVANQSSDTLSVINASNVVTDTIPGICQGPDAVAITPDGKTAYISCVNGDDVSVVNLSTDTVTATIPTGTSAVAVIVSPDGQSVYVANAASNDVSIISTSTNTVTGTITGFNNPSGLAITPDGKTLYVSNGNASTVTPVTLASLSKGTAIPVGSGPSGLALTPDATTLYVANLDSGTVSVIDTSSAVVTATIDVGGVPNTVVVNPEGTTAYAGQYYQGTSTVTPITVSNNTAGPPIGVGSRPESIAIDGPMQIGNAVTLPSAESNQSYSQPLWSLDGTAPVSYSVTSGSLPDGLSMSSAGVISGIPATPQTKTFTVTAIDSSALPQRVAKTFTLSVNVPPTQSVTLTGGASGAYLSGTTVYYNGSVAGSLQLTDSVTAYGGATPASASFPGIATTGWTHSAETVSTPSGGPFSSSTFSWSQNPSNPAGYSVTGTDSVGGTANTPLTFVDDSAAPTGGALSVNGTAATSAGSSSTATSASFAIDSRSDYTDSQSGLSSSTLTVQSETLSGSTCGAAGSGGPFTSPTTVTATTQPSGITAGYCYLYTLTGVDNVGNTASISTDVQVSNSAPTVGQGASYSGAIANTTFGVGTSPAQPSTTTSGNLITDSDTTAPDGYTTTVETGGNPATTTAGGSVTVDADGTFTYDPPAGFSGTDSFPFTVTDGHGSATGTASITVANDKIWYVNSSLQSNGNGTAAAPFDTLSAAQSASGPGADIFLFTSTTSYGGGIALQSNQGLVGQSVGLVVDGDTVNSGSGSNPTITNSGGAGVTLASGVTIEGVDVSGTSGAGITGALGSDTIAGSVAISNTGGPGLDISGGASGTLSDAATIDQTARETSVDALAVSNVTSGTVDQSGAITGATDLSSNGSATINISGGITASTGTLEAFEATNGGIINVTGAHNTLATTTVTALDVESTNIGSSGLTFESISAGSPSAGPVNGIYLIDSGTGGLTVTGSGTTPGSGGTIYNKVGPGISAESSAVLLGTPLNGSSTVPDPIGPVSLSDMTIEPTTSSPGDYGVYETNVAAFTLENSMIEGPEQSDGVMLTGFGSAETMFEVADNSFTGGVGAAIDVDYPDGSYSTTGTTLGSITANTIGSQSVANSGSTSGNGIQVEQQQGSGTMTLDVSSNDVYQIEQGFGIAVFGNSGSIELTMKGNDVQLNSVYQGNTDLGSNDAMTLQESGGEICANIADNTGHAVNTNEMDDGDDAVGLSAASGSPTAFQLQGYTGSSSDASAIQSYLNSTNTLSGPSDPTDESIVSDTESLSNSPDFVNATCAT